MEKDKLRLFNLKLVEPIVAMNDDELWNFLLENEERIKFLTDRENFSKNHLISGFLFAYPHGMDWFKEKFTKQIEYYREGVIFSTVMDFCFEGEAVTLEKTAQCAFLDSEESCGVKISGDFMPCVDEDTDEGYYKKYFHLLEPAHAAIIIEALEKNFDKLETNTREDIDKIIEMKKYCLENEGYKIAYIFDGA